MWKTTPFLVVIIAILVVNGRYCVAEQRPVHILPLGDSITQGGIAHREEYTYRLPLQRLLVEKGVNFDFIGSMKAGFQAEATWPDVAPGVRFDPDHEGHYGWKTAAVRDQLRKWLQLYEPPDIVLIHLGTNDQDAAKGATSTVEENALFTRAIVQPLEEMIAMLRDRNSEVVILVGHLNFKFGASQKIRPLVEAMATRLSTQESPVITVHHYRNFVAEPGFGGDTFDWAHPNPQGQKKMADAWFQAMQPYLQPYCMTTCRIRR